MKAFSFETVSADLAGRFWEWRHRTDHGRTVTGTGLNWAIILGGGYAMDELTPPAELVQRVAMGKCIAVVGAGLSRGAGLPDWRGAIQVIYSWAESQGYPFQDRDEFASLLKDRSTDLLMLAAELADQLGPRYRQGLNSVFRTPSRPTDAHQNLASIPFVGVITTNYDKLIETAWSMTGSSEPIVCTHAQDHELGGITAGDHPFILKAHGTIDQIDTIVLGRRDYQQLLQRGAYQQCMSFLCAHYSWLFLGFSLTDPDLRLTLDTLHGIFGGHTSSHYALMPSGEAGSIVSRRFQKDNNITVIPYKPSSDSHPEVAEFLSMLRRVLDRRQAEPSLAVQFVQMQKAAGSDLDELNRSKAAIGDAEYLRRLVKLTKKLWDGGARRQAWTSVTGPFERLKSTLPDEAERIEIGIDVARMVLEDAGALRAATVLSSLVSAAEQLKDRKLSFAFWELWARCLLAIHDLDGAKSAIDKAGKVMEDEASMEDIRARASEAELLAGRFNSNQTR